MALFKSKTNRRSSSSSYTSTLTTLVCLALCALAIWMLSSNSVVSNDQGSNTRFAVDNSELTTNDLSAAGEDSAETTSKVIEEPVDTASKISEDSVESTSKIPDTKETQAFGDNPGQLPEDAIKSDDKNPNLNVNTEPQNDHISTTETQISEESSLTQTQQAEENKKAEEIHEEPETVSVKENQQQSITGRPQEDAQIFDSQQPKKDILEEQLKQLREDKGETVEKDLAQQPQEIREEKQPKQDENPDSTIETSQQEEPRLAQTDQSSELSMEDPKKKKTQKIEGESEENQKPKTEKKTKRRKDGNKDDSKSLPKKPKKSWSTQADESKKEKEGQSQARTWELCNVTAGTDYIPCLDNEAVITKLHSRKHFEHRERHCPEEAPSCLVPLPPGYKRSIEWPDSRDKIWYHNVPHTLLAEVKGHQNWVKVSGEFLTFPGGGTQFIHGALHYIDFIQEAEPKIAWGKHTRVILDVGCGVGSFGGFLFERDVVTMSFAPKDEHEAQVQFALERGIPAISAVMGSQRLQFPSMVFDLIHCARCRVPWHADGGLLLLELNRLLRPGGYFVWSATPVYQKLEEDVKIWKEMSSLTKAMCWELVTTKRDKLNQIAAAIYRKPTTNKCYEQREKNFPPMCKEDDDPNAAWYVPLVACMHRVPEDASERGTKWPYPWPRRLHKAPYWLNNSQIGIYGKPSPQDFVADDERWRNVVDELSNFGITWSNVRNVMDMRAVYGGFAAALRDLPVWVFNVVNVNAPDTLPIIYERGLFGMYHDWCESFSTYPRTYDLLHADSLFSNVKTRCGLVPVIVEVDRILRPEGKLIVHDEPKTIHELENLLDSLQWEITLSKKQEGILCAKKSNWRP
ncbi:probable methyltransferase PMT27 [Prosopis cineraria]|uniref:probable methyltransferase PMT27 n=1 Tax=Prosopis cineraria TaxID=364024 RepID=UPI00240FD83A|nr:probable methyltransferase PMT27 [Prosopis cineraria]